jgi:molecular chaperone GrpE
MDDKKRSGEDDAYVIEDTGDSIEDIEQEMEAAAQEADQTLSRRRPPPSPAASAEPASEEVQQWKNRYMRTMADFENFRKRTEREKADYYKYALAGLMKDLLPVLDNFDRALDHAEEGDDFHKGVLLIYKQLYDLLTRAGLKPIDQAVVKFDPNIHEAVIREENPSVPNHTVLAVLQKGYFLHDRLLRPAMVKVAVGGPEQHDGVQ